MSAGKIALAAAAFGLIGFVLGQYASPREDDRSQMTPNRFEVQSVGQDSVVVFDRATGRAEKRPIDDSKMPTAVPEPDPMPDVESAINRVIAEKSGMDNTIRQILLEMDARVRAGEAFPADCPDCHSRFEYLLREYTKGNATQYYGIPATILKRRDVDDLEKLLGKDFILDANRESFAIIQRISEKYDQGFAWENEEDTKYFELFHKADKKDIFDIRDTVGLAGSLLDDMTKLESTQTASARLAP